MTLVIFDCDGVLVDSEPISIRIDVELLAEVGLALSEAEVMTKARSDLFHAAEPDAASSCVVVEDSRYGVQAARAAGMDVLAYASGLTPADVLAGPGTVVFDDMRELPQLLRPR